MTAGPTGPSPPPPAPARTPAVPRDDTGLRCPRCDYNVTGLVEPRCPECGETLDWNALRAAAFGPRIPFERLRGRRKPLGFLLTAVSVLLAPWVFARQATARIDARHGLSFLAVCFASTLLSLIFDADGPVIVTWLITASVYILLQTAFLTLVSPSGWRRPLAGARFWLLVGCYTSAVMMTEFALGPPLIFLSDLVRAVLGYPRAAWLGAGLMQNDPAWVAWIQLGDWLLAVACCFYARVRVAGADGPSSAAAAAPIAFCLFLLYAATVEYVGQNVYEFIERRW